MSNTLQVLVDIRTQLEELNKAQGEMRKFKEDTQEAEREVETFWSAFKQGVGIGSGVEMTRRAVDLLKQTIRASAGEALRLAGEFKDSSETLRISAKEYQVLRLEFKDAGTDAGRLTETITTNNRALVEARDAGSGAAQSFRTLGLRAAEVEKLPVVERLIAIARAAAAMKDETLASEAAAKLLGSRGIMQLLAALQRLATDGYKAVADQHEAAGKIMSDETMARLDRAQKKWEGFWHSIVIHSGEALGAIDKHIDKQRQLENDRMIGMHRRGYERAEGEIAAAEAQGKEPTWGQLRKRDAMGAVYAAALMDVGGEANVREAGRITSIVRQGYEASGWFAMRKAIEEANAALEEHRLEVERTAQAIANAQAKRQGANKTWDDLTPEEKEAAKEHGAELAQQARFLVEQAMLTESNARTMRLWREEARLKTIEDAKALSIAVREAALVERMAELEALSDETNRLATRADIDPATKQAKLAEMYERQRKVLAEIVLLKQAELSLTSEADPLKRATLEAEIAALKTRAATFGAGDPATGIEGYRERARNRLSGPDAISAGEGVEAGLLNTVSSMGSQGEQVAQAIQSSIGATVSGISDGIHGWITGVSNFGDMVRNIGSSVLKVFLDTIVQMGVQWVINGLIGKATITSLSVAGMAARKAETADVVASEGVKAGPLMANAAASSISSWGIAAAIGVAALIAAMAAFGGFAEGGYTGDGDKYALAGVVHRGEVVWSQADVRRAGGVASVEAARLGGLSRLATMPASVLPAPASYAPAPLAPPVMQSLAEGGGAGGRSGKGGDKFIVIDRPTLKQIMHDDPTAETYFAEMMYRHRGNLFS